MTNRFIFNLTIESIFERTVSKHVSGAGKDAIFETAKAGWYAKFGGLTLFLGNEKPALEVGQKVRLILEKANGQS